MSDNIPESESTPDFAALDEIFVNKLDEPCEGLDTNSTRPFNPATMQSYPQPVKVKKTKKLVPYEKYTKLVEAAKTVLAQYKSNHRELRYPGMQDLSDALELPDS